MDLVFAFEGRFERCRNGKVYSQDKTFLTLFCKRYLDVFDTIFILARVLPSEKECFAEEFLAESERVRFIYIPHYIGPVQYLRKCAEINKVLAKEAVKGRAYICRVPGQIGNILIKHLRRKNLSYGVEVVGDPWEVFAPGVIKHPLSPLFRIAGYRALKRNVAHSVATLYVTESLLQKRYPTKNNRFTINASNVTLADDNIVIEPKQFTNIHQPIRLISVGSLAQMYKSPDVVIKAVSILKQRGINCHCVWLGDGVYKNEMIKFANRCGVGDNFTFKGNVQSDEVRTNLQEADIFILGSRTEGLPRAMIEAMAVGLPCIGSKVGGIPELLDVVALIEAGNEITLADKILEFIQNEELINSQARRNLVEVSKYKISFLTDKRKQFYNEVIKMSK